MFHHKRMFARVALIGVLVVGWLVWLRPSAAKAAIDSAGAWRQFQNHHRCVFAVEGAVSTKTYLGLPLPPPPPQGFRTVRAAVNFLRAKMPGFTVWRDKINKEAIHIVYTKALKWKANPLNQRLTFRGKMSLLQVASRIIRKRVPLVHLACVGSRRVVFFPDVAGDTAVTKDYETPFRLDVKGLTLREFLTAGLVYETKGQQAPVILWRADYSLRHGELTGHVGIMIFGEPLRAAPSTAATTHGRTAK